jgi:hypothetical protein
MGEFGILFAHGNFFAMKFSGISEIVQVGGGPQ